MGRERQTERDTVTVQSTKHEGMGQCVSGSYLFCRSGEKKKTRTLDINVRLRSNFTQFDVANPTSRSSCQTN